MIMMAQATKALGNRIAGKPTGGPTFSDIKCDPIHNTIEVTLVPGGQRVRLTIEEIT